MITVEIRFFAIVRELAGTEVIKLPLPDDATVRSVRELLVSRYPALERLASYLRLAVNLRYADDLQSIIEGDQIAVLPPVSGG